MRKRLRLGISLIAPSALVVLLGIGCVIHRELRIDSIKDLYVERPVRNLAAAYPDQFNKPFTLLVLTDESATCGMREARWWRDWEAFMNERGWGFLLATSHEDSLDLVIAAELDSVNARTLVVPSSRYLLREVKIPIVPLNLLVDSNATVLYARSAIMDTSDSRVFMDTVAAIAASYQKMKSQR